MSWEEDLQNTMFIGEKLVWKCWVKMPHHIDYIDAWENEEAYFTTQRILWKITEKIPQDVPYNSIGGIDLESPGSGGLAGVKAFASGGGIINIASNVKPISFQFSNKERLQFAEWLLREVLAGSLLRTAEGIPEIEGKRDPHAPPPTPKKGCFIATVTCSPNSYEVIFLSKFRDDVLNKNLAGRSFIKYYYAIAPTIAKIICNFEPFKALLRVAFVKPIVTILKRLILK